MVVILTSQNPVTVMNANGAGTTYEFEDGIHRITGTKLPLQDGDTLKSQSGIAYNCRIVGSEDYSITGGSKTWTQSGSQWYVSYTRTVDETSNSNFIDSSFGPRAEYIVDVMVDRDVLNHADDAVSVGANDFYYDDINERIYIGIDPTDREIEISRYTEAINASADDVTIENLSFELFAQDVQKAAVRWSGDNWIMQGCRIIANHGVGVKASGSLADRVEDPRIADCYFWRNGSLGLNLNYCNEGAVESCEFAENNWARYNQFWEAGATKVAHCDNMKAYDNYIHDNLGNGFWFDIDNRYCEIGYNLAVRNYRSGIYYEISFDAKIFNNFLAFNNREQEFSREMDGGQIEIHASQNVDVFNNIMVTSDGATRTTGEDGGVSIKANDRGSSDDGLTGSVGTSEYLIRNITVYYNQTYVATTNNNTGGYCVRDNGIGCSDAFDAAEVDFDYNEYYLDTGISGENVFRWWNGSNNTTISWTTWQGTYSQDANGALTTLAQASFPAIPAWTPAIRRYNRRVAAGNASAIKAYYDWTLDSGLVNGDATSSLTESLIQYDRSLKLNAPLDLALTYQRFDASSEQIWDLDGLTDGTDYRLWLYVGEEFGGGTDRSFEVDIDGVDKTSGTPVNPIDSSTDGTPNDYFSEIFGGRRWFAGTFFNFTASGTSTTITLTRAGNTNVGLSGLMIEEANSQPIVTAVPNQSSTEGDVISLQVTAVNDAYDSGQTLTYGASSLPTGLSMNTSTGEITGTIGGSASTSSPFNCSVTVTDDGTPNKSDTVYFIWHVADNVAPTWGSTPAQSHTEGETVSIDLSVTDPDNGAVTLSASPLPAGITDTDNGNNSITLSGTISGGASGSSPYTVTMSADDGVNSPVEQDFEWTIEAQEEQESASIVRLDASCYPSSERLEIMKGLPFPTNTNEPPFQLIDLSERKSNALGFSLVQEWTPNIATAENGGVWATSGGLKGRKPQSLTIGNAQETIQLSLTATSWSYIAKYWARVQRWVQDARNFGTTYWQTTPLYLHYRARNGLSQYALIYNMDAVMKIKQRGGKNNVCDISISLEREGAWRALPFGDNPTKWAIGLAGDDALYPEGVDILSSPSAIPLKPIYSIDTETISNNDGDDGTQNYIKINAADIPGDAPALLQITQYCTATRIVAGISTKAERTDSDKFSGAIGEGTFTNSGSVTITQVTTTASLGVSDGVNYVRAQAVCANGSSGGLISFFELDKLNSRGRYAIFIRGGTNGGASGLTADLVYEEVGSIISGVGTATITGATTRDIGTVQFGDSQTGLYYVGDIEVPLNTRTFVDSGFADASDVGRFKLSNFVNTSGSSQTLFLIDLIMMPIDEGGYIVTAKDFDSLSVGIFENGVFAIDATGFLSRSITPQTVAVSEADTVSSPGTDNRFHQPAVITENNLYLKPNVDTRILFLSDYLGDSAPNESNQVFINIIPRWYGMRDE